jgi:phosphoribosyl-AMP cyclohydrolase / phosphoribosyl-ATP pyrophosphohydrolase
MTINWEKVNGLIPAIIQDNASKQILMLGYMNEEAWQQTLISNKVTFYSRSRKKLWTKGETSGNELHVIDISLDCDNDTLLIQVNPVGPCCHRNTYSCFGEADPTVLSVIFSLELLLEQRYQQRPANSYVSQLFAAGMSRIAQKVGEEGVEVALAGVSGIKENIINESADLLFHLLVLLKQSGINFTEVCAELNNRYAPIESCHIPNR